MRCATDYCNRYAEGESTGPQLLARLDGGRLRGSDEFVAHEPCPPLYRNNGDDDDDAGGGGGGGGGGVASRRTVLLTNRRLVCVQHGRSDVLGAMEGAWVAR